MPVATATRAIRTLAPSQSITTNLVGATWDLSTAIAGSLTARISNGATPPAAPCALSLEVSVDGGTTWREAIRLIGPTAANSVTDFAPFNIPEGIRFVRPTFVHTGPTSVTVEAYGHETVSLAIAP
jgi:hypothetical protein